jgi:hypothetical protein
MYALCGYDADSLVLWGCDVCSYHFASKDEILYKFTCSISEANQI